MYSRLSREELGGRFLGPMAYLDPKGEGDSSMPLKRRPCSGAGAARRGTRVIGRKLDCLNPNPQEMKGHIRRKPAPDAGAAPCPGLVPGPWQPPGRGAMPSEGIEGDEWDAYVTLSRTARTNMGSPTGRESYGDGGPVVVAGVTTGQGRRESRLQGEGGQVTGYLGAGRYA